MTRRSFLATAPALALAAPGATTSSAQTVLAEELKRRGRSPENVVVTLRGTSGAPASTAGAEGYRIVTIGEKTWIVGSDARGALYGVGHYLRHTGPFDTTTTPVYAIRGHQLGYRAQANSYDAWDAAQFDQYIRELTFFGVNAIEGIPLEDDRKTPVMKTPRREMNRAIGATCQKYGIDYWAWIPAVIDLKENTKRTELLRQAREFFQDTPVLHGIFFPGGDPGHNPPELVLPFLADMAAELKPAHPNARIWLSLQWFSKEQQKNIYQYIEREKPWWFAGLVAGPSSPPLKETRERLPRQYKLRDYPDITHNKLCQYDVPEWDQAYALTLGREAINPRPAEYAAIHARTAPFTDGFISYSDGVHDDVNKVVWSALSWDPNAKPRDIMLQYARVFFGKEEAADAILALERNWHGPLIDNGAVEATLQMWDRLALSGTWRGQMCELRAVYDAYVRRKLIADTKSEEEANRAILSSKSSADAIEKATSILSKPFNDLLRARIVKLCDDLYRSIGLQTSVEKYHAIGAERGAVLDFIDLPLNNRWWLEDEFAKVKSMPTEEARQARLKELATWENPGPGSYYDDIANIAKSPHVTPSDDGPTYWWWDNGKSRARLSWQTTMWPAKMTYDTLDPDASYVVRCGGLGQMLLRINGERIQPDAKGDFPVPAHQRQIVLTWDHPVNEEHLNWRQKSRLAEVWLIKK